MKKKILLVLCVLFGLMFINAGLNKFFNYMPPPDNMSEPLMKLFTAMMQISWLMPLVGLAEVIGGILFIIPRFRALGALILCPVLTGILLINLTVAPEGLPIVLPLIAIWFWVVIDSREKYLPIVSAQ